MPRIVAAAQSTVTLASHLQLPLHPTFCARSAKPSPLHSPPPRAVDVAAAIRYTQT